jgi:predicted Zn-dependent protease
MALISYFSSSQYNEVTGEKQYIGITEEQEIALGLQAVPEMLQQFGGLYDDPEAQAYVDQVGNKLVQSSVAQDTEWDWEFYLLADSQTINAFALPGGPVFITYALFSQLETEGQLAGILGHEIGHVLARHSAQRLAKAQLTQGLTQAVLVVSEGGAQGAAIIGQMVNMKYGREDELESDKLGVQIMVDAGYDPRAMIGVMEILAEASSGNRPPEFFSTHPNPDNRIERIQDAIDKEFPNGVPDGLEP